MKKEYSTEALEAKYNDITALYDYAEELVATVESQFVQDPDEQLSIVEPLINDIGDAADLLGEEFILVAESRRGKANKSSKTRVESALRKIYVALGEYHARTQILTGAATGVLKNIADPIVAKIQRQVEKIIAVFLEFVQISLYSIMNKTEVEALRVRNVNIAMMMHQHAMSQQQ